jgi:hypothetical protein
MPEPRTIRVFLSAVSDEFRTYRDLLRSDLTRQNVEVKVQEDSKDLGGVTLEKLDAYIKLCDAVVHLIGDMSGTAARKLSTEAILRKYPGLPKNSLHLARLWRRVIPSRTRSGRLGLRFIIIRCC